MSSSRKSHRPAWLSRHSCRPRRPCNRGSFRSRSRLRPWLSHRSCKPCCPDSPRFRLHRKRHRRRHRRRTCHRTGNLAQGTHMGQAESRRLPRSCKPLAPHNLRLRARRTRRLRPCRSSKSLRRTRSSQVRRCSCHLRCWHPCCSCTPWHPCSPRRNRRSCMCCRSHSSARQFHAIGSERPRLLAWVAVSDHHQLNASVSGGAEALGRARAKVSSGGKRVAVNQDGERAFAVRAAHAVTIRIGDVELVEHAAVEARVTATREGVRCHTRTVVGQCRWIVVASGLVCTTRA